MNPSTQKNAIMGLWLLGFVNMIIAEFVTLATPQLIYKYRADFGVSMPEENILLILIILIEAGAGVYTIFRLRRGKMDRLENVIGAGFTLLFILFLGSVTPGYLVFSIIETVCLLSLIVLMLISKPLEEEKS